MNNLKQYIIEKLHLDKNITVDNRISLDDIINLIDDYIKENKYNKWLKVIKRGVIQVDIDINNIHEFYERTKISMVDLQNDIIKKICDYTNDKNFITTKDILVNPYDSTIIFKFYKVKDNFNI